jgi:hypothetical protein
MSASAQVRVSTCKLFTFSVISIKAWSTIDY